MELPDMTEEEIDVQEACDAGLVDREDLVDARSTHLLAAVLPAYFSWHVPCEDA